MYKSYECPLCGGSTGEVEIKMPLSSHAVLGEVAPIKTGEISNLGYVFCCGKCNSTNIKLVVNNSGDYKHFKYCPDCGTKVDWRNFT